MAKRQVTDDKQRRPDDEVRFTAIMRRDERARLKYVCERLGVDMEVAGARWLMERVDDEEKKLAAKR